MPRTIRKPQNETICAVSERFRRFAKEDGQDVRKAIIRPGRNLEAIEAAWKKAGSCRDFFPRMNEAEEYLKDCISHLPGSGITKNVVLDFCLLLASHQDEPGFGNKAGLFLTALISRGKCKSYRVEVSHLAGDIDYLGFYSEKTIYVHGNLGKNCGLHMKNARIFVDGNVGDDAGGCMQGSSLIVSGNAGFGLGWYMIGSSIEVLGNAGDNCGMQMFSGTIRVRGNVARNCGVQMGGGEIWVCGDIGSISTDICRGSIYHRGKPAFRK